MDGRLTLDELGAAVAASQLDTVIVAFCDMQGRLMGKRVHGPAFLDGIATHGAEGCNYLLAVDVDMNTIEGYAFAAMLYFVFCFSMSRYSQHLERKLHTGHKKR